MIIQILTYCFNIGVPLAVAAAMFGTRWKEGLWGNALSCFAVVFSALIAVGWWESLTIFLVGQFPSILFLGDYMVLWILFLISLLIIGEVTRALSRVKVKFPEPIEKAGNGAVLALLTLLLLGFFYFSMDLSPIGEKKDAITPSDSMQIKTFRILTGGNLSSFTEPRQFDENGTFRNDHLRRRQALMYNCLTRDGGSMFYEGSIPPRK